ncbi:MAG: hypothetical protein GY943_38675 [Chloroflexi bacterium]|nr:hypothetical protein [Chloroflexota bacterium]
MKYVRWIGFVILILIMGYLSAFGLFADSSIFGFLGVVLVFVAGSAGVGALIPERWKLSSLCSWGAVLMVVLEIEFRIGHEAVSGQQPIAQVLLIGFGAVGLALLGGYIGYRIRTRNGEVKN